MKTKLEELRKLKCPHCNGKGRLIIPSEDADGIFHPKDISCVDCSGMGLIPSPGLFDLIQSVIEEAERNAAIEFNGITLDSVGFFKEFNKDFAQWQEKHGAKL